VIIMRRGSLLAILLTAALAVTSSGAQRGPAPSPFAAQISSLSEPGGYFDTDNLISNERSYQQVLGELRKRNVRGGAYLGVGPDQNFTYIAQIRPAIAFVVDVRRDNLLLHLLFKALFAVSRTRVEYLAHLTGRPVPAEVDTWRTASIDKLIAYIDGTPARPGAPNLTQAGPASPKLRSPSTKLGTGSEGRRHVLDETIGRFGVPLSADDRATIDRFHRRFVADGLSLRFESTGRAPQSYYPTFRDLLRDTDDSGRQGNYLASEDAFQFLKGLQARDLIIPVVGDLSGPSAVAAIGRALAARQERVSAFYVSNVEFYLFGNGVFPRFAANLDRLPHAPNAVVIRSIFGRYASPNRPGDASASRVQSIEELRREHAAGRIRTYSDIAYR
jgi:hypothetical protein